SSDYVAAFIGMANRLELVRRHEGWTTRAGTPVDLDAAGVQGGHISGDAAVGRMRPDDLALRRSLDEVAPGDVGLAGELVTSEYGGRHFDVTVNAGGERLYLRADAAQHGPWLRGAATGSPLVVSFSPTALRVFPHPDGHVDLQVPVLAQATARSEA
ncbi:MAG: TOBE domain-containing protein, partial [Rhodococcus sp. (in: high G+C Gram-positive bacteria)]